MQLDLYWDKIMAGQPKEYHGEAVNPQNLSLWERMLGRGRVYIPAAHAAQLKGVEMSSSGNRAAPKGTARALAPQNGSSPGKVPDVAGHCCPLQMSILFMIA